MKDGIEWLELAGGLFALGALTTSAMEEAPLVAGIVTGESVRS